MSRDDEVVIAYQDVTLAELRSVLGRIDLDLADALEQERTNSEDLDGLESRAAAVRQKLEAMGAAVPAAPPVDDGPSMPAAPLEPFTLPAAGAFADYDQLVALARWRLEDLGVDLDRDPLLQVLPAQEVSEAFRSYAARYGDVEWSKADVSVVLAAALVGTLLDILVVGTPEAATVFGTTVGASPVTAWLKNGDIWRFVQDRYLRPLERRAHVPYDQSTEAATGHQVSGNQPKTHRLQSLDHDPLLGIVMAMIDLAQGKATFVDKEGDLIRIDAGAGGVRPDDAFMLALAHLLSDVGTPAGLPAPFLGLLQLVKGTSPFSLREGGPPVSWTDLTRWMYVHGMDLRHFMVQGLVPGAVTAIVTGYWLLDRYSAGVGDSASANEGRPASAKLTSMLALAHALTVSGTLVKTGFIFRIKGTDLANPSAFNWAELLTLGPVVVAWIVEASRREVAVRRGLSAAWDEISVAAAALGAEPGA